MVDAIQAARGKVRRDRDRQMSAVDHQLETDAADWAAELSRSLRRNAAAKRQQDETARNAAQAKVFETRQVAQTLADEAAAKVAAEIDQRNEHDAIRRASALQMRHVTPTTWVPADMSARDTGLVDLHYLMRKSGSATLAAFLASRMAGQAGWQHYHLVFDLRTLLGDHMVRLTALGSLHGAALILMLQHPWPVQLTVIDALAVNPHQERLVRPLQP